MMLGRKPGATFDSEGCATRLKYNLQMIRCLTIAAVLVWLAKPSCVICCGVDSARPSRWQTASELASDSFPPSEPTCCLLDTDKGNLTHDEQVNSEAVGRVVERLRLIDTPSSVNPSLQQRLILLTSTFLMCSVLLI
jgi:hypothetical protein